MNNKGFTLIELLITVSILAILVVVAVPSVQGMLEVSNKSSYNIMVNNIKQAGITYYQECDYQTLTCDNNYITGNINGGVSISLKELASYGLLTTNKDGNIYNPQTKDIINECMITVTKVQEESKYIHIVTDSSTNNCNFFKE
ncbi:MAG: prepilin-type N-terminal cleavage/methylation domain-containing protein [bacterium]|nr:prepilin-type N-terminal cleavage/methylation domain-containing protein [bacterium]